MIQNTKYIERLFDVTQLHIHDAWLQDCNLIMPAAGRGGGVKLVLPDQKGVEEVVLDGLLRR
jgi:hypothetical protein